MDHLENHAASRASQDSLDLVQTCHNELVELLESLREESGASGSHQDSEYSIYIMLLIAC